MLIFVFFINIFSPYQFQLLTIWERTAKDKVACGCEGDRDGANCFRASWESGGCRVSSKTVQDRKSVNPRGRSGVAVPWDAQASGGDP